MVIQIVARHGVRRVGAGMAGQVSRCAITGYFTVQRLVCGWFAPVPDGGLVRL
jgi:hypothetical protein